VGFRAVTVGFVLRGVLLAFLLGCLIAIALGSMEPPTFEPWRMS
jgi:hypothetical protein